MNTKICTSIEQSKKLVELGIDINTADMCYSPLNPDVPWVWVGKPLIEKDAIPAWSLSALLDILQKIAYSIDEDGSIALDSYKDVDWGLSLINVLDEMATGSNIIDACIEMICRLKENGKI